MTGWGTVERMTDEGQPTTSARDILRLAVPAFGALVAQPLFTLVDAAIVGTLGTTPLAALGAAAQVFTTITGMMIFLAYGTTAVVARRVGAGQAARGLTDGIEGMALGLVIGLAATAIVYPTAPWIIDALGASAEAAPQAVLYLRIVSLSFPLVLAAMAMIGVLRGLQDTRTTLWVTVGATLVNAALAAVFVLALGWGIAGAAWATVIAEVVATAAYTYSIVRRARLVGASLRPSRSGVLVSAKQAVPLLLRTAALRAVFLLAVVVAARMGDAELAAYYVSFTVWYVLALGMDALAIAAQALLGRHLGAGAVHEAQRVTWRMTRWGVGLGVILCALVLVLRPWLPGWFTDDPEVAQMVATALLVVAAQQPLAGVVFVLDGVLLGAGDAAFLAWAQLLALLAFAPVAWLALQGASILHLWLAMTAFMVARAAAFLVRIRGGRWLVTGAPAT